MTPKEPDRSQRPTEKELSMPIEAFAEMLYFDCSIQIQDDYPNYDKWLQENGF